MSPNTAEELGPIFADALERSGVPHTEPEKHPLNESQDFGLWTGLDKEKEKQLFTSTNTDPTILKHPLFMYPGGDAFVIFLAKYVARFQELANKDETHLLCTHSSSLQALVMGYNVRLHSLASDVMDLRSHKENQSCTIGIGMNQYGLFSAYGGFAGTANPIPVLTSDPEGDRDVVQLEIEGPDGENIPMILSVRERMFGRTISCFEKRGYDIRSMKLAS